MPRTTYASRRTRLLCISAAIIADLAMGTVSGAYAQGGDPMEPVIVTGTRLQPRGFEATPQFVSAMNDTAAASRMRANGDSGATYSTPRGLGRTSSLALVNGRKHSVQTTSQIADLNTIPTAPIERTEAMTDGLSSVYESNAIVDVGGSIQKRDFEGAQAQPQYGLDGLTKTKIYAFDLAIADSSMRMPQPRWMTNASDHYDLSPRGVRYAEFHFSNNVNAQLTTRWNGCSILT